MKPVAISIGDPSGIGPEVSLKAVCKLLRSDKKFFPLLVGDRPVLEKNLEILKIRIPLLAWDGNTGKKQGELLYVSPRIITGKKFKPGCPGAVTGKASFEYFKLGWTLLNEGKVSSLVTAPISKAAWHLAGIQFSGHTEALKEFSGEKVQMLMVTSRLRVLLVTTHLPLRKIWTQLSTDKIAGSVQAAVKFIRKFFPAEKERIGFCSINPHAGESGYMGREETDIIIPAIRILGKKGIRAEGPYPADTLFWKALNEKPFDLIVAFYHDQALIPLKTFFFRELVNVSTSLNWIRTSPGHGTAYEIAYTGRADESSMVEAARLAVTLSGKL